MLYMHMNRNTDKVVQAAEEARKNTPEADEKALKLLEDSEADIVKIVSTCIVETEINSSLMMLLYEIGKPLGPQLRCYLW